MIEAKRLAIGNAKREAGNNRKSVESRVIWTPNKLGTLAAWNEQSIESNGQDVF